MNILPYILPDGLLQRLFEFSNSIFQSSDRKFVKIIIDLPLACKIQERINDKEKT